MIKAIIFDLDGVLVQTEKLKSLAYAKAVQRIRELPEPDFRASEAYRAVIGASRETTSNHVMTKLGLEAELRPLMAKYGNVKEQHMIAFMIMGVSFFVLYQLDGKWWIACLAGACIAWAPLFSSKLANRSARVSSRRYNRFCERHVVSRP